MATNPYATQLGHRNAREVIAQTPGKLSTLAGRLGPEGLKRSLAPGKWTARDILCHLADTELAFAFRLRQSLAEPHHVIQPFDQDSWSKPYPSLDAQAAIATFSAVRAWNLALLETVPAEAYARTLNHPERGDMTFQVLVETIAGHDLNHLGQLETIAAT
jgi:Mycothiol maleylpyruvate isomerase N-terminal domain.